MIHYFRTLCLVCTITFLLAGCSKDELNETIPWAPVEYTINLRAADNYLDNAANFRVYTSPRLDTDRTGYSGLIVYNTGFTYESGLWMLTVFDRCCPYEDMRDVVVTVAPSKGTAECSKCKTVYSLMEMGKPISGVGRQYLQRYKCNPDGFNGLYRISR